MKIRHNLNLDCELSTADNLTVLLWQWRRDRMRNKGIKKRIATLLWLPADKLKLRLYSTVTLFARLRG